MIDNMNEPWEGNPANPNTYLAKDDLAGAVAASGYLYRAGYDEPGPKDFLADSQHHYDPEYARGEFVCSLCAEALAKYESWRLKQISGSKPSESLPYPQAVEIIRNVLTSLGEASTRGFSYEGEWRDRGWLLGVLEVVLKGGPK